MAEKSRDNHTVNQDRTKRQINISASIIRDVASRVAQGVPADTALADVFRAQPSFGARDRRIYAHAVFSWFRWRGWIETWAPGDVVQQCVMAVIHDPATDAPWRDAWQSATGITLPSTMPPLDDLAPAWLPRVLPDASIRREFITACATRPPTWVRIEPSIIERFTHMLAEHKISFSVDMRIGGAIGITSRFHHETLERSWGAAIQVQDIASQAVNVMCGARAGEQWWDACAGAGGKTLALAQAVGANGRVCASDIRETILENLRTRAGRHALLNIEAKVLDASNAAPDQLFNGVLVDAPCSGIGTWPRNPDARWRLAEDDIAAHAARQQRILARAARAVKPGGSLVYSVCSIAPIEGIDVAGAFLQTHPAFTRVATVHPLTGKPASGPVTIDPQDGPGDGMFVARFVRQS